MARKKQFQWAQEEEDVTPFAERRDAKADKAQRVYLEALGLRLASMTSGARELLPLGPEALQAIAIYTRQGPKSSRRRQLLRIAQFLREADLEALEDALEFAPQGGQGSPGGSPKGWAQELMGGGDGALNRFLEWHPHGDRQQLRVLARQARSQEKAAQARAEKIRAEGGAKQPASKNTAQAKLVRALTAVIAGR